MHFLKQKLMAVTEYIPPARPIPPGAYPSRTEDRKEVGSAVFRVVDRLSVVTLKSSLNPSSDTA